MRRECRDRFPCHRVLAIQHASRTRRYACQDRLLAVFFEVGGGENVLRITAHAQPAIVHYLVGGPL